MFYHWKTILFYLIILVFSFGCDNSSSTTESYVPIYSSYSPSIPASLNMCEGTVISVRSLLSCSKKSDGVSVDPKLCPDPNAAVITQSPEGIVETPITNGTKIERCLKGVTVLKLDAITCIGGYHPVGETCVVDTYQTVYYPYSPPVPSVISVCDGTITSRRSIMSCFKDFSSVIADPSQCVDDFPEIISISPAGNKIKNISGGSEVVSCALGSSTQSFISRSCDSGYYDTGSGCNLITYTSNLSSYSPTIPSSLNPCDGLVSSSRTLTCVRNHDGVIVNNSNCPVDNLSTVTTQSPAGEKIELITNGTETYFCGLGSTFKTLMSKVCNSSFHNDNGNCVADSYTQEFSTYTPDIPTNLIACNGTVESTRSMICRRNHDSVVVSNSYCPVDSLSSVFTLSPAGNKTVLIPNGSEIRNCVSGSSNQTFVSRSCDVGFHNNGVSCVVDTYTPQYSSYSPLIPSSLNICDGTVVSNRTMTCIRDHDSFVVPNLNCPIDTLATVSTLSPAGNKIISIAHGSESINCNSGSSSGSVVSRTCDLGYFNNGSFCEETLYSATYSSYSPSIPSSLNACDGTVISNRTMTCIRNQDSAIVSNSNCPADPTPFVITQSPSGNKSVFILNGSEIKSCPLGSTVQSFVSRTCDSGYYDTGIGCSILTYTPVFTSYSPSIPSSLNPCDGTVISNRTMTCVRDYDFLVVSNTNCPSDPVPSITTVSPSGNKIVVIPNGSNTFSCSLGSTSQSFVSRTCDSGYYNDGSSCSSVGIGYYSDINSSRSQCPINSSTVGANSTSINDCLANAGYYKNGSNFIPVGPGYYSTALNSGRNACTNKPSNASTVVYSLSDSTLSTNSCAYSSVSCDSGYMNDGLACFPVSYTGVWSNPSNPLTICDNGSVLVNKVLTDCIYSYSSFSSSVSLAFCSGETAPTVSLNAPTSGTAGIVCAGGSIYAGSSGSDRYMTTPGGCLDLPLAYDASGSPSALKTFSLVDFPGTCSGGTDSLKKHWNDGSSNWISIPGLTPYGTTIGIGNSAVNLDINYGSYNTSKIALISLPVQGGYHAAALFCERLTYGGYSDWYLPNRFELNILYVNKALITGFNSTFTYWSSTEYKTFGSWGQNFSNGSQDVPIKNVGHAVRCVRRY